MLKPSMPGSRPSATQTPLQLGNCANCSTRGSAGGGVRARAQRKREAQRSAAPHGVAPGVLPIGLPSAVAALSSNPPLPPLRNGAIVTVSVSPAFTIDGRQPKL